MSSSESPRSTTALSMAPDDAHNRRLLAAVHPPGRVNPQPAARYNLVVVGAGTAGLVSAAGAAGLGAKVALVERHLMGGDCLNVGCVPSKGLISAARRVAEVRDAARFGVYVPEGVSVDFGAVMERMRRLRAAIAPNDSVARFTELGVDVFLGSGRFGSGDCVQVEGAELHFSKAVIATGARAAAPPIPGLDQVQHLTNETLFSLTELPASMVIVGAGPIGCEMAQCFARFGTRVTLVETGAHVLPREEQRAALIVEQALVRDGVEVALHSRTTAVAQRGATKLVTLEQEQGTPRAKTVEREAEALLVAVGRAPNVEGMGLEAAGVRFDPRAGVMVDDGLRSTNPNVYAAGDVASRWKFTHTADFLARIVIQNALFPGPQAKASALCVPWCTYTDPEVAHVGLDEAGARERGLEVDRYEIDLADVDRAILDGETEGYVSILTRRGKGTILGATIVARHAGEMISEISVAMKAGAGLGTLAATIHPYPTQAEAIRRAGDQFNRTRLTPLVAGLMRRWLSWSR